MVLMWVCCCFCKAAALELSPGNAVSAKEVGRTLCHHYECMKISHDVLNKDWKVLMFPMNLLKGCF